MPRGASSEVGTERIAANGYTYVKVEDRGWVLKHWLIWEQREGRQVDPLRDMIRFKDGDRTNFDPSNIIGIPKNHAQLRAKIARLEVAAAEIEAQLKYYRDELTKRTERALSTSDS